MGERHGREAGCGVRDPNYRGIAVLCAAIAVAVAVVAGIGVFGRGGDATASVVSVRGERYEMVTEGAYAYNAQRVVAEGVGWDIFTLFAAVPVLLITIPGLARGSLRARLVATGLLGYLFYQYLMYAMTWAFGPLFLPFVAVYAASLAGIGWIASTLRLEKLPSEFDERFPLRGMAWFSFIIAAALVVMWAGRIVPALRGDLATGMLLGQTTMVVQGLDLGLIVPLAVFTGVAAWRRRPIGYALSAVLAVKGMAMAAAITLMVVMAGIVEGSFEWGGMAFFAAATVACLALGARMWRSVRVG